MSEAPAQVPGPPARPARADARRNYDRLVAAATEAFSRDGFEASLDGIAKAAGVGPGTLYRHFPTRLSLLEAVYVEQVEQLREKADRLAADLPPYEALDAWSRELALHGMLFRGIKEFLAMDREGAGLSYCRGLLREAVARLVQRAKDAGEIRTDADSVDILRLLHGVSLSVDLMPEAERAAALGRLLDLVLAGLRPR